MTEYEFPVNTKELRHIMKNYLNPCGKKVSIFADNFLSKEWSKLYLVSHPRLSERFAENVTTRAAIDETDLRNFLNKRIKDVPESNI